MITGGRSSLATYNLRCQKSKSGMILRKDGMGSVTSRLSQFMEILAILIQHPTTITMTTSSTAGTQPGQKSIPIRKPAKTQRNISSRNSTVSFTYQYSRQTPCLAQISKLVDVCKVVYTVVEQQVRFSDSSGETFEVSVVSALIK